MSEGESKPNNNIENQNPVNYILRNKGESTQNPYSAAVNPSENPNNIFKEEAQSQTRVIVNSKLNWGDTWKNSQEDNTLSETDTSGWKEKYWQEGEQFDKETTAMTERYRTLRRRRNHDPRKKEEPSSRRRTLGRAREIVNQVKQESDVVTPQEVNPDNTIPDRTKIIEPEESRPEATAIQPIQEEITPDITPQEFSHEGENNPKDYYAENYRKKEIGDERAKRSQEEQERESHKQKVVDEKFTVPSMENQASGSFEQKLSTDSKEEIQTEQTGHQGDTTEKLPKISQQEKTTEDFFKVMGITEEDFNKADSKTQSKLLGRWYTSRPNEDKEEAERRATSDTQPLPKIETDGTDEDTKKRAAINKSDYNTNKKIRTLASPLGDIDRKGNPAIYRKNEREKEIRKYMQDYGMNEENVEKFLKLPISKQNELLGQLGENKNDEFDKKAGEVSNTSNNEVTTSIADLNDEGAQTAKIDKADREESNNKGVDSKQNRKDLEEKETLRIAYMQNLYNSQRHQELDEFLNKKENEQDQEVEESGFVLPKREAELYQTAATIPNDQNQISEQKEADYITPPLIGEPLIDDNSQEDEPPLSNPAQRQPFYRGLHKKQSAGLTGAVKSFLGKIFRRGAGGGKPSLILPYDEKGEGVSNRAITQPLGAVPSQEIEDLPLRGFPQPDSEQTSKTPDKSAIPSDQEVREEQPVVEKSKKQNTISPEVTQAFSFLSKPQPELTDKAKEDKMDNIPLKQKTIEQPVRPSLLFPTRTESSASPVAKYKTALEKNPGDKMAAGELGSALSGRDEVKRKQAVEAIVEMGRKKETRGAVIEVLNAQMGAVTPENVREMTERTRSIARRILLNMKLSVNEIDSLLESWTGEGSDADKLQNFVRMFSEHLQKENEQSQAA